MKKSWIHQVRGWTPVNPPRGQEDKHEEQLTRQGFMGPVASLYRPHQPGQPLRVEGDLRVRAVDAYALPSLDGADERTEPIELLKNDELIVSTSRRTKAMPYCYRNATADLLYFVHRGVGVIATEFGPIRYEPGDYVLLPKGVTFRHLPASDDGFFLVIESKSPIGLTEHEQIGRHMPFDLTLLEPPTIVPYDWPEQEEWEVRIKYVGGFTSVFYRECPFNVVGWKGDLYPFKINVRSIMPLMSERIHLAPSSWATFQNDAFMVATFLPQVGVSDMAVEELQPNHRSIDADEVFLIHEGGSTGAFLHNPQGIMHGPSAERRAAFNAIRTPEYRRILTAINIDAYRPLQPTEAFRSLASSSPLRPAEALRNVNEPAKS
jgi:homogentisate 1,2-dioxygenase